MINLIHGDCVELMREMDDNSFDLAVVDPPYGINIVTSMTKANQSSSMYSHAWTQDDEDDVEWDGAIPSSEYFEQLQRVSKHQIIWGGNYFIDHLSNTKCMLVWDKNNGTNPMADCELAWTSFDKPVRKFTMHHFNAGYGTKIHPTQKPVKLYEWIFDLFAQDGWKILDTHLGSGSIAIAAHNMRLELTGIEINQKYFQRASQRLTDHQRQLSLPW